MAIDRDILAERAYIPARPPLPHKRRIVILVIAALVVAAGAAVANHQPLRSGNNYRTSACFEDVGDFISATGEHVNAWRFTCTGEKQDSFLWGVSLRNDGPFPITVIGLEPLARAGWDPMGPVQARISRLELTDGPEAKDAFAPFRIAPGEQWFIEFYGTSTGRCSPGTTTSMHAGMGVTYRLGPLTRRDMVDVGPAILIECPYDA